MCNLANTIFGQETPLRIHTHSSFRAQARGVMLRWAGSTRRGFASRYGLLLSAVVGFLWLGAAPVAWAASPVTFNGVVSTQLTPGINLNRPTDVAVDASDHVYIVDSTRNQIVTIDPQGAASTQTISGLSPGLAGPGGITVDGSGTLYITDPVNNRVVKVSPPGTSGAVLNTGSLSLSGPRGITIDAFGNIFIADTGHSRIVELPTGGAATVFNITGLSTPLGPPDGLTVDTSGNLYIADPGNHRIVKVAAGGNLGSVLSITGLTTLANPTHIAVDSIGNVYISDTGSNRIVKVTQEGEGSVLDTGDLELNSPSGVAVDVAGTVYIANTGANQIVTVATSAVGFGHVQLGATTSVTQTMHFSVGTGTTLGTVSALTLGIPNLDFTVADGTTCTSGTTGRSCTVSIQFLPRAPGLRRGAVVLFDSASPPNRLLTVPLFATADSPLAALSPSTATVVDPGEAIMDRPSQLALDGAGDLYVGNSGNGSVLKVAPDGGSSSVVSTGSLSLDSVTGMALDGAGNLFIGDQVSGRILAVTPEGTAFVLTITGLSAQGFEPTALTFDAAGNLYIADAKYGRIVKVSSLVVTTGTATGEGSALSTGSYTLGPGVLGVAVDAEGTLYVADPANNHTLKVTADGAASLLVPAGITPALSSPQSVSVDGMGNVYIADTGNARVVKVTTAGMASVVSTPGLNSVLPLGVAIDPSGRTLISDGANNRIVEVPVSGASLAFPHTRIGLTSPAQTATVTNLGNQRLVFAADPIYTANFSQDTGDPNPCTSATTLSSGTVCDVPVDFTPKSGVHLNDSILLTNNALNVNHSTQQVSVSGTALLPGDTTATTVSAVPSSLTIGQAVTLTAMVADTTPGDTSNVPTGEVTFTDTVGTTLTSLNNGLGVNLSAGKATLTGVVLRGVGTHTITAVYSGVSDSYLTSTGTTTILVSQAQVTLTVQPVKAVFGQTGSVAVVVTGPYTTIPAPSGTISYTILNSSSASVASGTLSLTVGSTSSTATFPIPSTLSPGSYTINVTYSGDSNYLPVPTATPVPLTVSKATPTASVVSSVNPVFLSDPVTFTATISSTVGTPTGSVNFVDGQTLLSTVSLVQGVATYTTSSLALGAHSITVTYSGDSNFANVTSPPLAQTVIDFALSVTIPTGQAINPTVLPGGTLNYIIQVSPTSGNTFPSAVTFSASGLPAGAAATFTPSSVTAGSGSTSVTMAIQLGQQIVALPPVNPLGRGLALAMVGGVFLLPFGRKLSRSRERAGRFLGLLILALAATCGTLGLAACGGSRSGYFAQQAKEFTVTVTATSGALSHTTTVNFILE